MTNPDPCVPALPVTLESLPAHAQRERHARARWATRALFGALGVLGGVWGAHIPSLKSVYGLDEASLSLVLFCAAIGAVSSLFVAGRVIGRLGARRTALVTGLVMAAAQATALLWPSVYFLMFACLFFGTSMSIYDVAINAEGTALEHQSGQPVMGNLHGCFSLGAMAGAALAAAALRGGVDAALQMALSGALLGGVALSVGRHMLDARPTPPTDGSAQVHFVWPRGLLLVIGLLIFAGMTAEGVMYDWCVLYLKQEVGMPQDLAALGYAAFAGAMAVARFGGDALRSRYSERTLLRNSALLAAVAMAVVLTSGEAWVSLIGYAFVGAGLAPIVPILYTAASRVPGTSSAAAIAAASSIGYSGFLVGPPLIGGIAHAWSLTAAMTVVVIAAAALAIGARRVG
ncbi:major facilitator superfamily MFS_1 [Leptothrix cholodnii SP-6]|uniref:Major facilitator superfamily MFS_1 n=1 Tax=Leptothrix cholodnii (strain ATCC 51168 / LMG 8142 / SP-6) TaxID=395495 RepID=B1Y1K3_LEPCP|nr:MFS transporter [Leptothrix cholodnii]ACB35465.1 major facilitator superfamily MFS_1 [Leptothrix cholodnii SP-6]